jgi:hypothetical protein
LYFLLKYRACPVKQPCYKAWFLPEAGFNRVNYKSKDIHAIQELQALDQIQKIGLVHIVDGQAGKGSSGYHMIYPS